MCGVVGDTKPQFSIVGANVDKAEWICHNTEPNTIKISEQTYKATANKVNNFVFEAQDVSLFGIMTKIYQVQKRRGINRRLANRGNFKNLYNKSASSKPQQLQDNNHNGAIGEQNSEEELNMEEI